MGYQRILVPLDLSPQPSRALEVAARLIEPAHPIGLVHVIAEVEGVDPDELEEFYAGLRARAQEVMARRAAALEALGRSSRIEICIGRRGPEILRLAEQDQSELIVLSSHRIDPARPGGGLGTLSHQIALLAHCDVLLVR